VRNTEALAPLDDYFCGQMYRQLYSEDEELFNFVKHAIENGATPWDVRNLAQMRTAKWEQVAGCHAAATFMLRQKLDREETDVPRRQRRRRRGR
jgi:hypothetical protein